MPRHSRHERLEVADVRLLGKSGLVDAVAAAGIGDGQVPGVERPRASLRGCRVGAGSGSWLRMSRWGQHRRPKVAAVVEPIVLHPPPGDARAPGSGDRRGFRTGLQTARVGEAAWSSPISASTRARSWRPGMLRMTSASGEKASSTPSARSSAVGQAASSWRRRASIYLARPRPAAAGGLTQSGKILRIAAGSLECGLALRAAQPLGAGRSWGRVGVVRLPRDGGGRSASW